MAAAEKAESMAGLGNVMALWRRKRLISAIAAAISAKRHRRNSAAMSAASAINTAIGVKSYQWMAYGGVVIGGAGGGGGGARISAAL